MAKSQAPQAPTRAGSAAAPSTPRNTEAAQFERVKVRRGYDEVYSQIRREIAEGRLVPGDRLPAERDMALTFGVSRQSVREALRLLEASGLVQSKVGVAGGAFIREGDTSVVMQNLTDLASLGRLSAGSLLEARILITSEAIRLASTRGTAADFDRLDEDTDLLEKLTATGDFRTRAEARVHFYHVLGEATHNEVFGLLVDALTAIVRARMAPLGLMPREDLVPVRRKIVDLMRKNDADSAISLIVEHFKSLEEEMERAELQRLVETKTV